MPTIYGHYVNNVEVVRARNAMYNHMMNGYDNNNVMNQRIGNQMITLGRRVTRSEWATRIS